MNDGAVSLYVEFADINFVKEAILQRAQYLVDYIDGRECETRLEMEEQENIERKQLETLRHQNEKLQERLAKMEEKKLNPFALTPERIREMKDAGFWTRQPEKEIQDIEMNEFQAELREMIAKHTPAKRGRPVGSKNKEKANAE